MLHLPPLLPYPKDLLHFTVSDFMLYLNVRTVNNRFPEFGPWFGHFEHGVGAVEISSFHARGEGMRVLALESREGTRASRRAAH